MVSFLCMENAHRVEVIDKLLTVCRAGRAGRRLELVPAFAQEEARLLAIRAELVATQVAGDVAATQSTEAVAA